jgi:hypothetical protein
VFEPLLLEEAGAQVLRGIEEGVVIEPHESVVAACSKVRGYAMNCCTCSLQWQPQHAQGQQQAAALGFQPRPSVAPGALAVPQCSSSCGKGPFPATGLARQLRQSASLCRCSHSSSSHCKTGRSAASASGSWMQSTAQVLASIISPALALVISAVSACRTMDSSYYMQATNTHLKL